MSQTHFCKFFYIFFIMWCIKELVGTVNKIGFVVGRALQVRYCTAQMAKPRQMPCQDSRARPFVQIQHGPVGQVGDLHVAFDLFLLDPLYWKSPGETTNTFLRHQKKAPANTPLLTVKTIDIWNITPRVLVPTIEVLLWKLFQNIAKVL